MKFILKSYLAFMLLVSANSSFAIDPINKTWVGSLAIKGYDTVAYFTDNKAVKGSKQYQLQFSGVNWRFSSAENLALFEASPEKYMPQYGGYCAWAVSNGETANIDPKQFTIVDGLLYLNYNKKINKLWLAERDQRIELGDQYWPKLLAED